MSELESILNYLETTSMEPHDDYTSEFSYKEQKVLWKYIKELQQENQELKKQLSNDHQIKMKRLQQENKELKQQISNSHQIKNQQKEFIEWLEDEIDKCKYGEENYADGDDMSYHNENELRKEILSKYKEIIGSDNK